MLSIINQVPIAFQCGTNYIVWISSEKQFTGIRTMGRLILAHNIISVSNRSTNLKISNTFHVHGWLFRDHCLNYLRQVIMCYADLTPMRYDWDQGAGRLMLQDEPHTCRNYKKIDEWARPRASCHVPAPHQPETVKAPPRGSCVRGPYFADE